MNKDLISGFDLSVSDINAIFSLAKKLKKQKNSTELLGKTVGLVFQKPSVRTRVSFEVGARQLGAECLYLAPQDIQLGSREPIKDVARVLSRYLDGIVARTFSHTHILELARYAKVSVINGLSDLYHPCQALADVYTVYENAGKFKGVKLAYIGDGNNVLHSLLAVGAKVGLSISAATPKGYEPDKEIWQEALKIAKKTGTEITHCYDAMQAVNGADFVYTDVWTSMGQEKERKKRLKDFRRFQVNAKLLEFVGKKYRIMHCMPVHRQEEITDEVMESKSSIVFEQAENRLHVQKAVMALLIK
ncbi:MAG: ornithine carbamoyltransferase [Candidatus Omnitrophica bacterium]|nr:ornithine carbamoyltransferase [Candidatus Omnitrophota bacterium]